MSSTGFLNDIRKIAEDVAVREGCYLYDLEFVGTGSGRTLRVTIDKEGEGGVGVDDCSNVSRGLNLALDVEDVIPGGQYMLEVSSPGLERVLKEPRHYERAIGQTISIKSFAPLLQFNESVPELGKAKSLQGRLLAFDDKGLKMSYMGLSPAKVESDAVDGSGGKEVFIPFESLTKAHVVHEFVEKAKPKPGGKKGKPKK